MEDLEKRITRLEGVMSRLEQVVERMATSIESFIEVKTNTTTVQREVDKLRVASHEQGNQLQKIPYLKEKIDRHEKRQDNIEERVELLEKKEPLHTQSDTMIFRISLVVFGVLVSLVIQKLVGS